MELRERLQAALAGRYTVESEIGRGGMAIVFLARDLRHDRDVALKVLRPELAATLGTDRFLQEIKLAAGLAHPHILPLYDSGSADGCLYYVMPFVRGESLRDLLERERSLPLATALQITREVVDALTTAHEAGIVHRDVKPENILLHAGHAVVSDFGIARAVNAAGPGAAAGAEHLTTPGTVVGTRVYMSPEQAYGAPVDGRADIYGLGCTLYEMLTGNAPSGGSTPGGHHTPPPSAIRAGLRRVRPPVGPGTIEAVVRALAETPERRFSNARAFGEALAHPDQAPRWSGPRLQRLIVAGLLFTFAAVVSRALWPRSRPDDGATSALDPTRIAVLYFNVTSDSARLWPVANGLTEDLIDALSQVRALSVISSAGVSRFRGHAAPPDSVGRVLHVGSLVTGSLTGSGEQLRVVVRLIDPVDGRQLFSRSVMRPMGDLFQLEDSLVGTLSDYLRTRVGQTVESAQRRAGTRNVAAWESLRQGDALLEEARALKDSGDDSEAILYLQRADSVYRASERFDPRWALPIVEQGAVASTRALLASFRTAEDARRHRDEPPDERSPRYYDQWLRVALGYANRALALDPEEPLALNLRGAARYGLWNLGLITDSDSLAAIESDLRRAIALQPTLAKPWYWLSRVFENTGRFREAYSAARSAMEADAYLSEMKQLYATLFYASLNRERFDDAAAWCDSARTHYPGDPNAKSCAVRVLGWSARGRDAVHQAWRLTGDIEQRDRDERSGSMWADRRLLIAMILARSGLVDSALALVRIARMADPADSASSWMALAEANVRLLLGDRGTALGLLGRAIASDPNGSAYMRATPWFASLQGDPAFERILRGGVSP